MQKLIFTAAFALLAVEGASAEERQAQIEVSGLWCASCSYIAGEALQKSESVEIVSFEEHESGESGVYTITFDDSLASLDDIVAQPTAYGYQAKLIEDSSSS